MGARSSQLRNNSNRQQVHDSSSPGLQQPSADSGDGATAMLNGCDSQALVCQLKSQQLVNGNDDNNNAQVDAVAEIKDAIRAIETQQANGNSTDSDQQQQANGSANGLGKSSTLQRHSSQIQSLAQRIRRSSSIRAPKSLRNLFPLFVNAKRKVSMSSCKFWPLKSVTSDTTLVLEAFRRLLLRPLQNPAL